MNNKEFYQKWGRSDTLKYLVNTIVVIGLETITKTDQHPDPDLLYTEEIGGWLIPGPIELAECYRDLKSMPDGFIKNVIKKVL